MLGLLITLVVLQTLNLLVTLSSYGVHSKMLQMAQFSMKNGLNR